MNKSPQDICPDDSICCECGDLLPEDIEPGTVQDNGFCSASCAAVFLAGRTLFGDGPRAELVAAVAELVDEKETAEKRVYDLERQVADQVETVEVLSKTLVDKGVENGRLAAELEKWKRDSSHRMQRQGELAGEVGQLKRQLADSEDTVAVMSRQLLVVPSRVYLERVNEMVARESIVVIQRDEKHGFLCASTRSLSMKFAILLGAVSAWVFSFFGLFNVERLGVGRTVTDSLGDLAYQSERDQGGEA